ncbi:hypothetical protein RvY_11320-2 [Ramazzottius varieornatus]|uniref:Uncharacterized protein n=1 Tax=Ramazzottius varieornatus TaxID=947166 RepID=A0A1D1VPL1_RAMVA|nr:hypothetical protein RvY_11320-2 [Ramazzottius varieornatus]
MASDHQEDTRSDETYVRIHGCFSTRHCLQSRTQRRESGGYRRSQVRSESVCMWLRSDVFVAREALARLAYYSDDWLNTRPWRRMTS